MSTALPPDPPATDSELRARPPFPIQNDRPDPADLSQCVHCGLCLQNCPTYLATGNEAESPRGRIHLIQALQAERLTPTPSFQEHIALCLVCRNCETVCPSGVPFGRIMESARAQLYQEAPHSLGDRLFRRLVFKELLPHQGRLRVLATLLRLYQRSGLRRLVRATGLLPAALKDADRLLPDLPDPFSPRWQVYPAHGEVKARVGLFVGCVMPLMYGPVHEATIRVLTWNGCEVHVPPTQACCGALNVHGGERTVARELARRNFDAFLKLGLDAIVVNSAGCGSTMKEYGELLAGDARAEAFARLTKDVNEFLAGLTLRPPAHAVHRVITFQESCHLVHAQRIWHAPRALLAQVPGLELREMGHPDLCCGSAGLYSVQQRAMSMQLLDSKMEDVASTGATTVVTANPGCMLQLEAGLERAGLRGEVRHLVEILDEAYAGRPSR